MQQNRKYHSKISVGNYLLAGGFTAVTLLLVVGFLISPSAAGAALPALCVLLDGLVLLPMLFDTWYALEDDNLHVKNWIFCNQHIPYRKIEELNETKSRVSGAALSGDRIRIRFLNRKSKYEVVFISPKEKQTFLRLLSERVYEAKQHPQP